MAGLVPTGPFVGREAEKALGLRALDGTLKGRGGLLLISGPTGCGKSRFADLLLDRASGMGFHVLRGAAVEGDAEPYAPFQRVLGGSGAARGRARGRERSVGHSGLAPEAPLAAGPVAAAGASPGRGETVGNARAGSSQEWGGVPLGELLGPSDARELALAELPPLGAAVRVLEQLQAQFGSAPVILAMENFHWADAGSLALLRPLAREARKRSLLILTIFETTEVPAGEGGAEGPNVEAFARAVQKESGAVRIALKGLSDPEVKELAEELLHAPLVLESDGRLPMMLSRAGGNPFFVQEIVRAGLREGWISKRGEGYRVLEPTHDLQVPTLLRWWVHRRISNLSPEDRTLLEAIAVLGTEFDPRALPTLVPEQASGIRRGLERLDTRHGLAHAVRPSVWRVEPAFLTAVVRSEMSGEQLRLLHRRAGEWQAAHDPTAVERIAGHYYQAGDAALGLPWLDRAWQAASDRGDNEAALRFIRWGLELSRASDRVENEVVWRRRESGSMLMMGEVLKAQQALSEGLARAPEGLGRVQLLTELMILETHLNKPEKALTVLNEAREVRVPDADVDAAAIRIASVAIDVYARLQNWDRVVEEASRLLGRGDDLEERTRCRALTAYGTALAALRRFPQAKAALLDSLSRARKAGLVQAEANARTTIAILAVQTGDLAIARAMFEQLSHEWGRRGGLTNQAINAANAAEAMLDQGDTEAAVQWLRDALELAEVAGLAYLQAIFAPLRARILLDLGQSKAAEELLRPQLTSVRDPLGRDEHFRLGHAVLAQVLLAEGRVEEARKESELAGKDTRGMAGPYTALVFAQVQAARGEEVAAELLLATLAQEYERDGLRMEQALALEALGDLMVRRRRYSEARARWDESLGLMRACGALARAARLEDHRKALPARN